MLGNRLNNNTPLGISNTAFSTGKQGSGNFYSGQGGQQKKKKKPLFDEDDDIVASAPIQPPFDMNRIQFLKTEPKKEREEEKEQGEESAQTEEKNAESKENFDA